MGYGLFGSSFAGLVALPRVAPAPTLTSLRIGGSLEPGQRLVSAWSGWAGSAELAGGDLVLHDPAGAEVWRAGATGAVRLRLDVTGDLWLERADGSRAWQADTVSDGNLGPLRLFVDPLFHDLALFWIPSPADDATWVATRATYSQTGWMAPSQRPPPAVDLTCASVWNSKEGRTRPDFMQQFSDVAGPFIPLAMAGAAVGIAAIAGASATGAVASTDAAIAAAGAAGSSGGTLAAAGAVAAGAAATGGAGISLSSVGAAASTVSAVAGAGVKIAAAAGALAGGSSAGTSTSSDPSSSSSPAAPLRWERFGEWCSRVFRP